MAARASTVFFKGILVSFIAACYFGMPAQAATITVDTTAITGTASECSLQDALTAANTNTVVNGCLAGDSLPAVDVVQLPAGTFTIGYAFNLQPDESVSIRGAGMASTILDGVTVSPTSDAVLGRIFELRDLTLINSAISINDSVSTFTMDHVGLDAATVDIGQQSKAVTSILSNLTASNDSWVSSYANILAPGNLTVEKSEFNGNGSSIYPAVTHIDPRANSSVEVTNSVIAGYPLGLYNQECSAGVSILTTLYITDTMIGGGGMQQGVVNVCGHLVINNSTFHDIQGAAVLASADYQTVDFIDSVYSCRPQQSSRIEINNSTFTRVNVTGTYQPLISRSSTTPSEVPYNGVITIDSSLNPECSSATQISNTDLSFLHTTFADNTFTNAGSANIGVMDGTGLRNLVLRNNALQGNALAGTFSASGTVDIANNLMTTTYAGPESFATGFSTVADFLLGPLQDNGGTAAIGFDGASGHVLTMRPLAGSPLIDAAPYAGLAEDERGATRSLMARYDIGAVEVTLAEFTADGGVYNSGSTTTDRLAETGSDALMVYCVGVVLALAGCATLIARRS